MQGDRMQQRTQKVESLHILRHLLDTAYTIIYHPIPLLQLIPRHGAVREEQGITRVLLDRLGIVHFCAFVVAILEACISLRLELLGSILVAGRHGSKEHCFKIPVLTTPDEDREGEGG
jgi:hypothetical protein